MEYSTGTVCIVDCGGDVWIGDTFGETCCTRNLQELVCEFIH